MKAVGKNVVIEIDTAEADIVKKGKIFIPNNAVENSKLCTGTISSVGSKCTLGLKAGQKVLFDKYAINKYIDSIGALAEDNVILVEK